MSEDKPVLIKVGGDIWVPNHECSAGTDHYGTWDEEQAVINVNPRRPISRYFHRLIYLTREDSFAFAFSDRINLCYGQERDDLEVSLSSILGREEFDFFVGEPEVHFIDRTKRFGYRSRDIFFGKQKLTRQQRVRDFFPYVKELELAYLGSVDVAVTGKADRDVLLIWEDQQISKSKKKVGEHLEKYFGRRRTLDSLVKQELMNGRVLLALADQDPEFEGLGFEQLVELVTEDGYECACEFEDGDGEDKLRASLDVLIKRRVIVVNDPLLSGGSVNDIYSLADSYRKPKKPYVDPNQGTLFPVNGENLEA